MANTVHVKNIGPQIEEKEIKDFFNFCGKITDLKVTSEGTTKSATVTFEKATAAKTALLLNNTKLGDNEISVTGDTNLDAADDDTPTTTAHANGHGDSVTQEEKPRSRILAEMLAHGYVLTDAGLSTALALDEKHGISQRFLTTLQTFDKKYHATDRAKATDQSYGITQRANSLLTGLGSYFEKATNTPTGKRIVDFYTIGSRQVSDVHNEAKRLAELKKQEAGGSSYKAAGLHKVFGEQPAGASGNGNGNANADAPGQAPANAPAVESKQGPAKASDAPGQGTAEKMQ